jgi:hypothetical protein
MTISTLIPGKMAVVLVLLAGLVVFTAPRVRADDDCQRNTARIDHNLHEAIAHHGPDSHEANKYRQELAAQRAHCWDKQHRWWDEDAHAWRTERNWDDHDHDHPPQ